MNIIPFPRAPFFCAQNGRYLPGLTDLIIEAAAFQQRVQIEQELFKIRLRQKCFVALATRGPKAIVLSPQSAVVADAPLHSKGGQ